MGLPNRLMFTPLPDHIISRAKSSFEANKILPNRLMFTSGDKISKEKSSKLLKKFENCGIKFNIKFSKGENEEGQHFTNQQNYIEIHPIFENFFLFKRLL